MKQLSHYVIMDGGAGFIFSNSNISDCGVDIEEGNLETNSGIKMNFKTNLPIADIVKCAEYQYIDKRNLIFQEDVKRFFRGESTSWQLQSVKVGHYFMWMNFFNRKLYDQYHDDLPYYQESATINWKPKDGKYVEFYFELNHFDTGTEKASVYFGPEGHTRVTELNIDESKREFYFPGFRMSNANEHYMVRVIDYYQ